MYVLLDLIYYVFFIVLQYREIPHQTPLMPHKTPTVSCDLQSCNRHATIQRFIVTACSDTGLSVLMGEVVLGRLESMHQHRMCPHYYCIPVDFCLIIVFLKSVVQAISVKLHGFLYLSRSRRTIKVIYYVDS